MSSAPTTARSADATSSTSRPMCRPTIRVRAIWRRSTAMIERVRRKLAADARARRALAGAARIHPRAAGAAGAALLPGRDAGLRPRRRARDQARALHRRLRRPAPPATAGAARPFLEAFGCPILPMRYESAELAKITINFCLVASVTRRQHLGRTLRADRRRLVGDRAGAEARPAHRPGRLSQRPASASPAAISSATCATVVQIGEAKKTDVGVVKAWLANSAHRKDWPWQVLQDA